MNKKFDLAKAIANGGKCRTIDGRSARIICTDARGNYPITALIADRNGDEEPYCYSASGAFRWDDKQHEVDLINIPERHVRWVNFYSSLPTQMACDHESRETADRCASSDRIACIRVEFEEGEGLE